MYGRKTKFIFFGIILFCVFLSVECKKRKRGHMTPDILLKNKKRADKIARHPSVTVNLDAILDTLESYGMSADKTDKPTARFMLDLYKELESGKSLTEASGHTDVDVAVLQADTVRSVPTEGSTMTRRAEMMLKFNITSISPRETLKRAELRLRPTSDQHGNRYRLRVTIWVNGTKAKRWTHGIESTRLTKTGLVILDVTPVLREALYGGYYDATVEISIRSKTRRPRQRQTRSTHKEPSDTPELTTDDAMLVLFSKDKYFLQEFREKMNTVVTSKKAEQLQIGRAKREASKQPTTNSQRKLCRRESFFVDFNELGWGKWIVYPKKFNAYLCDGKCPKLIDYRYDPTNHALLQSLMRIKKKKNTPRPCCAPTQLRSTSMLYWENEELVVRHHDDMIVDTCGCR